MMWRFAIFALAFALAAPAWAQTPPQPGWVGPRGGPQQGHHGGAGDSLNTLFDALKVAPDEDSAKAIEERIWSVWIISGSDTCDLLMGRAKVAMDAKEYDLAVKLLDAVIALKPSFTEAWNRRATVYYLKDDYARAIADLGQVLAREPRHFAALSGLGLMLQEIGDNKDALTAYRKALAIDPHLEHVPEAVKSLSEKVEGRNI